MRGTTLLQSLIPSMDGRTLLESFEGLNWQTDQDWFTLQGTPLSSSDAAVDGLKSFKMSASPETYPQIESRVEYEMCVGYFRDDHTETASTFKPFLLSRRKTGSVL